MLDVIAALILSAVLVIFLIMLIGTTSLGPAARAYAYGIVAGWAVLMIGIAASGGFASGAIGPVPGPVLGFAALVIGGLAAWFWWPAFRDTLLAVPLSALIGINAFRIPGSFSSSSLPRAGCPHRLPNRPAGATSSPVSSPSRSPR